MAGHAAPRAGDGGWLYNRTGSLFLVGLAHAAGNAAAVGSGFGPGLLQNLYDQPDAAELHLLAQAALGVIAIVIVLIVLAASGTRWMARGPESPATAARVADADASAQMIWGSARAAGSADGARGFVGDAHVADPQRRLRVNRERSRRTNLDPGPIDHAELAARMGRLTARVGG